MAPPLNTDAADDNHNHSKMISPHEWEINECLVDVAEMFNTGTRIISFSAPGTQTPIPNMPRDKARYSHFALDHSIVPRRVYQTTRPRQPFTSFVPASQILHSQYLQVKDSNTKPPAPSPWNHLHEQHTSTSAAPRSTRLCVPSPTNPSLHTPEHDSTPPPKTTPTAKMPGFIRTKPSLPHRSQDTAPGANTKPSLPRKTTPSKKRSAPIDLTSSPTKKRSTDTDLTSSPTKAPASKKRAGRTESPVSPANPSTATGQTSKKSRTGPLPAPATTPALPPKPTSLPTLLPANGQDYIHDPSGLLPQLLDSHTVATMQIISSSKMSAKIARSLDALVLGKIDMADRTCRPGLVVLYAKAPVAGKLVSVTEVVKREVGRGGRWFQYSALSETMVVVPRKKAQADKSGKKDEEKGDREAGDGDVEMEEQGEEEEKAYFETMKTGLERRLEGTEGMRAVPVLTVYLSRVPIEKLRVKYGEQTGGQEVGGGGGGGGGVGGEE